MICQKGNHIVDVKWQRGVTYEGIDRHHNPPEFISDFFNEAWRGEFYDLCRKHHRELHDKILIILNKNSNSLRFIKSEYWIMQKMTPNKIREAQKEIYEFTKEWIKKGGENDS